MWRCSRWRCWRHIRCHSCSCWTEPVLQNHTESSSVGTGVHNWENAHVTTSSQKWLRAQDLTSCGSVFNSVRQSEAKVDTLIWLLLTEIIFVPENLQFYITIFSISNVESCVLHCCPSLLPLHKTLITQESLTTVQAVWTCKDLKAFLFFYSTGGLFFLLFFFSSPMHPCSLPSPLRLGTAGSAQVCRGSFFHVRHWT